MPRLTRSSARDARAAMRITDSLDRLAQPTHLFLDWDSTLTMSDTMSILGRLPLECEARIRRDMKKSEKRKLEDLQDPRQSRPFPPEYLLPGEPRSSKVDASRDSRNPPRSDGSYRPPTWAQLSEMYMNDYIPHKANNFPKSTEVKDFAKYQDSLRSIEISSFERAEHTRFFGRATIIDVVNVAWDAVILGHIQMRPGWLSLLRMFNHDEDERSSISIVSVNWSATFIRGCLMAASSFAEELKGQPQWRQDVVHVIKTMKIYANEIENLAAPEGSSGCMDGGMHTSLDKCLQMTKHPHFDLRNRLDQSYNGYSVYVGDSSTDHDCLRRADWGVWMVDASGDELTEKRKSTFPYMEENPGTLQDFVDRPPRIDWNEPRNWIHTASDFEPVIRLLERGPSGLFGRSRL